MFTFAMLNPPPFSHATSVALHEPSVTGPDDGADRHESASAPQLRKLQVATRQFREAHDLADAAHPRPGSLPSSPVARGHWMQCVHQSPNPGKAPG